MMRSRVWPIVWAVTIALALVAYLLVWRGDRKANALGLTIELTSMLIEVVLVSLVVDQLAERRERKRWLGLHQRLAGTVQRSLVDLLRLNYLFVVPGSRDQARLTEFLDLARFSLGDLRSQVESFTSSLDPERQGDLRSFEESTNYLFRSFHSIAMQESAHVGPSIAYETHLFFTERKNWKTLVGAAQQAEKLLGKLDMGPRPQLRSLIESQVDDRYDIDLSDPRFASRFYESRFRRQEQLLSATGVDYVLLDASGTTNEVYFWLDCELLSGVREALAQ